MGNAFGKSKAEDEEHLNPEPEVQQATPESPPPTTPKKALTPKKATTPTKKEVPAVKAETPKKRGRTGKSPKTPVNRVAALKATGTPRKTPVKKTPSTPKTPRTPRTPSGTPRRSARLMGLDKPMQLRNRERTPIKTDRKGLRKAGSSSSTYGKRTFDYSTANSQGNRFIGNDDL